MESRGIQNPPGFDRLLLGGAMMDEGIGKPPLIPSIHSTEELSPSRVELNKKRKLQYELDDLGLPSPKHKFGDRFNTSGRGSLTEERPKRVENLLKEISIEIRDGLEQLEDSDDDSNSSIEDYDQTEGYVTAMALDIDAESGKSFGKVVIQDWPSTSSNSFNSNILKSSIDFLNMRNMIEANNREQAEGDGRQFDIGCETMEQRGPECEICDHLFAEFGKSASEHLDATTKDEMLYSNDVAPNAFVLPSGSWSTGHDARLDARKPTIDQEFEQYFSMLML
ncbi:uncharacterized protein [Elaeis guineensis]|uniref:uncharacterized protein n=1 Tax=Elaeis guineensis var. tenera TaxID=51953 RepID=UPI003C6CE85A